ncbi:extracellular solute-binding protein [Vallicoccus soli]|uniref:Extracellular solute-binding protein n=1 Tax=Vallicoccus soli TaxID=2339232 RepID=A0A3A3ZMT8_9ACTN|nr:extracellular solute-binding protein [Vallicoccus soli]RJK98031.1 extracellular solute-binding protein [Vallicoccus soli]
MVRPLAGPRVRAGRLAAAVAAAALLATACGGDDGGSDGGSGGALTVWTVEDLTDRVQAQQRIVDAFGERTGTEVELVPVAEDQLTTVLSSAAASDELPDVIAAAPLAAVSRLQTDGLLDTGAAASVVEALGEDTFSAGALELTRDGDEQLAVPSDGWAQLLLYRTDLFEAAGLPAPDSYEALAAAAAALDQGDVRGIVASTAPNDSFTQQTFEHVALANGCELVDGEEVALDSDACVESVGFWTDLLREHAPSGNQDVDTTRAAYFAGRAAMVVWSSFILDELAGLRDDALPTCSECAADPTFLAENTGIVTSLQGPSGGPANYGEVVSFAMLSGGDADAASELVQHVMGDAYEQWLAIAPEGKVPVRTGTADDPEAFLTAWRGLEAGVDRKAPLSDFYPAEVLDAVAASPETFARWGFPQGQGELAGAVAGQFVVPQALATALSGGAEPADAATQMAEEARTVQEDLGG